MAYEFETHMVERRRRFEDRFKLQVLSDAKTLCVMTCITIAAGLHAEMPFYGMLGLMTLFLVTLRFSKSLIG